jgi:hypothetical protein
VQEEIVEDKAGGLEFGSTRLRDGMTKSVQATIDLRKKLLLCFTLHVCETVFQQG